MPENVVREQLAAMGLLEEDEIPLAETALLLGALDHPEAELSGYRDHLDDLACGIVGDAISDAATRATLLADLMATHYSYDGDNHSYDDMRNANLIDVIDRRVGLPVALAVLYLHAARGAGWAAWGLDFPGHFLIRVDGEKDRAIVDPFNGGEAMSTPDLRRLLKSMAGEDAEIESHHFEAMSDRAILLRLLNNIRGRALAGQDVDRGIEIMDRMVLIAPRNAGLRFESGAIAAQAGRLRAAVEAFEACLTLNSSEEIRINAEAALEQLRGRLN